MKFNDMLPFRTGICSIALLAMVATSNALTTQYCSNANTADDGPFYSIYNSMGSCSTQCQSDYAFAVVQGKNCWCSNYIPSDQSSTSNCQTQCPGYPDDVCGNPDRGMYGYIPLGNPPLGTAGASSDSSSAPTSTSEPPTSEASSSTSLPPSTSSSSAPPETTTTKAIVKTKVTTIHGNPVTQTVTSTPVGAAPNNESADPPALQRTGLSGGAIAGVVIGTLLGLIAIAIAAFLLWRRRKNTGAEGGSSGSPKRKGSVLSRAGLLGGGARPQSMSENNYDDPYLDPVTRSNSIRHSMMFGATTTADGITPAGPLGSASDSGSEKRHSKPLVYDQRLNPSALWAHHDNGSRVSMQDQQDYSRPLGLANPDFPRGYSFDSR